MADFMEKLSGAQIAMTIPAGWVLARELCVSVPNANNAGALIKNLRTGMYAIRARNMNRSCPQDWAREQDECLRLARVRSGLTQKQLAEKSGVAQHRLSEYENGVRKVTSASGDTVRRLAAALDCSVEELI